MVVLVVVLVVVVDSVDVVVVVVVQSTVVGSISFHFLRLNIKSIPYSDAYYKIYLGSCVWAFTAKTPRRKVANFILPSFLKVTPPS